MAVAGGFLAGVAGTASMDTVRYLMSLRSGAKESPVRWEFPAIESWNDAPDPGQVARRVIEGFYGAATGTVFWLLGRI
jgi:hypothetical protein